MATWSISGTLRLTTNSGVSVALGSSTQTFPNATASLVFSYNGAQVAGVGAIIKDANGVQIEFVNPPSESMAAGVDPVATAKAWLLAKDSRLSVFWP